MSGIKINRLLLASVVIAGAGAIVYFIAGLDVAVQPAYSKDAPPASGPAAVDKPSSDLGQLRSLLEGRRFNAGTAGDTFSRMSWAPPPAPAVVAPKAFAKPVVPPFAYIYSGKLSVEGGTTFLFLTKGENLYSLSEGELLDGVFRIEAINENQVEVVHVATQTRLTKTYDELAAPISRSGSPIPLLLPGGTGQGAVNDLPATDRAASRP